MTFSEQETPLVRPVLGASCLVTSVSTASNLYIGELIHVQRYFYLKLLSGFS